MILFSWIIHLLRIVSFSIKPICFLFSANVWYIWPPKKKKVGHESNDIFIYEHGRQRVGKPVGCSLFDISFIVTAK
ncbi:hypothetical protein L596_021214 [Steinernema carpocapsae]|uniref:Uncharacterized protein n=1 Tax=Steinernema carpocapsae TaxID=34508 RepID=A0A4U5MVU8_STECR|nr:hypothetical protein L596_021214 [Steinernema carpocapsae]